MKAIFKGDKANNEGQKEVGIKGIIFLWKRDCIFVKNLEVIFVIFYQGIYWIHLSYI